MSATIVVSTSFFVACGAVTASGLVYRNR